jgi:hypothetical protein
VPSVSLGQSWPEGTKVSAVPKTGDFYAGGKAVGSTTVKKDGSVVFSDLPVGRYWFAGEVDGANVVVSGSSKETPAAKQRVAAPMSADPQRTPVASPSVEIVTGPKGTKVAGRLTEVPVPKGVEPHPHINQASVPGNVPQRSSTELGQGTPVDPDEPQPKPRQQDVRKGTQQASDTPLGEATPVSEDAGPQRQEDAAKGLQQRSSTETGEQTPIGSAEPRGTSSNPDSREQAAGERPTDEPKVTKSGVKPDVASKLKKGK